MYPGMALVRWLPLLQVCIVEFRNHRGTVLAAAKSHVELCNALSLPQQKGDAQRHGRSHTTGLWPNRRRSSATPAPTETAPPLAWGDLGLSSNDVADVLPRISQMLYTFLCIGYGVESVE